MTLRPMATRLEQAAVARLGDGVDAGLDRRERRQAGAGGGVAAVRPALGALFLGLNNRRNQHNLKDKVRRY